MTMDEAKTSARRMIRPDISVGNILTVLAMIVTIAAGWSTMRATQAEHDRRMEETRADLLLFKRETSAEITRLRDQRLELMTAVSSMQSDVRHLVAEVGRMRLAIEKARE